MAGRSDVLAAVRSMHNVLGGTLDPHAAYLLLRGLKTLDLRVSRQNSSAAEVSRRLEAHPKVCCLLDPCLPGSFDVSYLNRHNV